MTPMLVLESATGALAPTIRQALKQSRPKSLLAALDFDQAQRAVGSGSDKVRLQRHMATTSCRGALNSRGMFRRSNLRGHFSTKELTISCIASIGVNRSDSAAAHIEEQRIIHRYAVLKRIESSAWCRFGRRLHWRIIKTQVQPKPFFAWAILVWRRTHSVAEPYSIALVVYCSASMTPNWA